jgi:DNA primase
MMPNDFEIKVLVLPDGKDPDDYVRQNGTEAYNRARGSAVPFLDFVLDAAIRDRSLANAKQKAEAIEDVLPILTDIKNPIQKRESFDQAMNFFRVENSGLKRELWNAVKQGSTVGSENLRKQVKRATAAKITVAEQQLLELLVYDRELQTKVLPLLQETDYEALATAPVFRALIDLTAKSEEATLEAVTEMTGEDDVLQDFLPMLFMTQPHREAGEVIDEVLHRAENCILTLRSMAISNRILEVSHDLIAAEQGRDSARINVLVGEHLELSKMKQHLLNKISET